MPNILLIDDEPAIQHAFRRAFRDPDVALTAAATCREGVAAFEAQRPDVVVLDVHLPDATGLETFQRLHAVDARVPIVLTSRADGVLSRLASCALAVLIERHRHKPA